MFTLTRSKSPRRKKSFGPGRSAIRQAAGARGRRLHNLWYHFSPKLGHDVVLRSDLHFAHFCWVEADPSVHRYELDPEVLSVTADQASERTSFDVLVEFKDAPPELRELAGATPEADDLEPGAQNPLEAVATQVGYRFARVTPATLSSHSQLIRNWRCALAFQAACRDVLLSPFEIELRQLVRQKHECSLEELLQGTNPELRPQYLAALFACLQAAKLASDLDANPLCASSRIRIPEVANG